MNRSLIVGTILLAALGLWSAHQRFGWSFTESVEDRGSYFRLKVKLAYKGEPQDFDIVVGCNVRNIRYKDGSGTYEAGLVPTVYGRAMSDGKAVVIRPPDACGGETTANGKVPADFMPVIVVYDDAKTFGFGTAYISDEAYESPLSLMTFDSATIEPATRAEFDQFRTDGPPNAVTRESYHSFQPDDILEHIGLKRVWPAFGRICYAVMRFRIRDQADRDIIREYWPSEQPQFWGFADFKIRNEMFAKLSGGLERDNEPGRKMSPSNGASVDGDYGVSRRKGKGAMSYIYPPSFYPVSTDLSADKWPARPNGLTESLRGREEFIVSQVDVEEGSHRGFAYCYDPPLHIIGVGNQLSNFLSHDAHLRSRVDASEIVGLRRDWTKVAQEFFERDEFLFVPTAIWLDSVTGDV